MASMRVSDYIMACLASLGITHVFQVTGRGSLFLSDALAKSNDLESVSLHHEQSCGFAAISYAENNGRLGACLISTGCASTNAITPVLSAWQDGIPVIFISGQNILNETTNHTGLPLRTYGQQEANIVEIVKSITKYSHMLTSPNDIIEVMNDAVSAAFSGRKGPVWLDIPLDIQSSLINSDELSKFKPSFDEKISPLPEDIEFLTRSLNDSERPIVLVGKGIRSSETEDQLAEFIEKNQIPLVYSASAPDQYGSQNSLSLGSVGSMGCSRVGNFAVANCDLLIVLGSRLTPLTTGTDFCKFARHAKIIVVDIDPIEHSKPTIRIDKFIHADLSCLFSLLDIPITASYTPWVVKCMHWKTFFSEVEPDFISDDSVDLYQMSALLSQHMSPNTTLVTDSGLIEVILPSNISFSSNIKCLHPSSQGAMGFALPASIGASFASSSTVITVIGDGSIMMNLQELQSISYNKLPIKFFVVNNNCYSIIRRRQKDLFRKRTIGTDSSNGVDCPDFSKVATCFEIPYFYAANVSELDDLLPKVLSMPSPVLCEIKGREFQEYIEVANARSSVNNSFIRRPLEDQKPFLSRDVFLSEMIIPVIDQ